MIVYQKDIHLEEDIHSYAMRSPLESTPNQEQ